MQMKNSIEKYLKQDINNPKYLFHGSPKRLEKLLPMKSHDSNNMQENISTAIFLFPSLIKASAYAFKDTIKKNSNELDWNFQISNKNEFPVMTMKNVNIDENIVGYIYVIKNEKDIKKDNGNSLQYKSYEELIPIDIIKINYKDYKKYYKVIGE